MGFGPRGHRGGPRAGHGPGAHPGHPGHPGRPGQTDADGGRPEHGGPGFEGENHAGPGHEGAGHEGHGFDGPGFEGPGFGGPGRGGFGGPGRGFGGPGGPGHGFGPRGRGRGRGRRPRGDVRTAVLLLLNEEPMHGYQLMQTIDERTGGSWSVSPGAIYPTLSQLEDEGLVEMSKEGGRKLATLTDAGRSHVEENQSSWSDPFAGEDDSWAQGAQELRGSLRDLGGAVREATRSGGSQQMSQVADVLSEAKRSIYRILAGDVPPTSEDDGEKGEQSGAASA
ncbi:PadR family transcriptional regulator [Brachybacterium endophyticum]|uniref:PadR family transcriptional regulator n=2 Tax=Brachybacterium endophyticum TaxID=2182385 RepID=A0A2U2RPT8_9MICO|nr:PadR family transcriptional regulator [Brachybacterium endophyticum]